MSSLNGFKSVFDYTSQAQVEKSDFLTQPIDSLMGASVLHFADHEPVIIINIEENEYGRKFFLVDQDYNSIVASSYVIQSYTLCCVPKKTALEIVELAEKAEDKKRSIRNEKELKEREFLAAVEAIKNNPDFKHLEAIENKYSVVETAKNVRKHLKKLFGKTKFSVRTDKSSFHTSIVIRWNNGADEKIVEEAVKCFKAGFFDGMQDLYINQRTAFKEAFGSVDYISCYRDTTE